MCRIVLNALLALGIIPAAASVGRASEPKLVSFCGRLYDVREDEVMCLGEWGESPVPDYSVLSRLPRLTRVSLSNLRLDTIEGIGPRSLRTVALHDLQVSDLSPLADLALQSLIMSGLPPVDLGVLARRRVTFLVIDDMQFSAMPPLPLWHLSLEKTQTVDFTFLAGMRRLTDLAIQKEPAFHDAALIQARHLKELRLDDTAVVDLGPIAKLRDLVELSLARTPIRDIAPLAGLRNLEKLDLEGVTLPDLSALAGMKKLELLVLSKATIGDFSALAGLNLTQLDLRGSNISDLRPLALLKKLKVLWLDGTEGSPPLQGLEVLTKLPALRELTLNGRVDVPCEFLDSQALRSRLIILDHSQRCELPFLDNTYLLEDPPTSE